MTVELAEVPVLIEPTSSGLTPIYIMHDELPRNNGESDLAEILDRRGWGHWYEAWDFPLEMRLGIGSFRPDFVLKATRNRPPIILEVTEADASRNVLARKALERKHRQSALVLDLYRISTVIITSAKLNQIRRNWRRLDQLIEQKLKQNDRILQKSA